MTNLKKIMTVMLICLSIVNCSKKKGSSAVATAPAVTGYDVGVDGLCYDSNGTNVNMSLCTTGGSYSINQYGYCCDGNGNAVDPLYCDDSTVVCSGEFLGNYQKWTWFGYQTVWYHVTCDGKIGNGNCSGFDLIKVSNYEMYSCK